jgi:hypothetical protein
MPGHPGHGAVQRPAFWLESEQQREQEQQARPAPPFVIAAEKMAGVVGLRLSEQRAQKAGMALHHLLPTSWTPVYMILRRRLGTSPLKGGLASGAAMSLLVDQGVTPALGFSAPNRDYPLVTHIRAFVAHLVFGVVCAAVIEGSWRLLGGAADEPARSARGMFLRRRVG